MNCLLCNRPLRWQMSIKQLLSFGPLVPPVICQHCAADFHRYQSPFCPGCGRTNQSGLCAECQQWKRQYGWLVHNRCLFHYDDAMKEYMHRYKFMGDYRLRAVFHKAMWQWIDQQRFDYLIQIPVTQETMAIRGFNQTTGLIDKCDEHLLLTKLVTKKTPQSAKTREERLQTPQPFVLQKTAQFQQQRALLVDDIYTTGRTLYHAAVLFRSAGTLEIHSLTLSG